MPQPFAKYQNKAWPYTYQGAMRVENIAGGIPSDPNVAEGWIRSKISDTDDRIQELVAETMVGRGITVEEAVREVDMLKHLNGFVRIDGPGSGLMIEHRQLKAALKEATNVAVASGKLKGRGWGTTNKGLMSYLAEHVHVIGHPLLLVDADTGKNVTEPTRVIQRFVHTWRGSGIQYEEVVDRCQINFTIITDHSFTDEEWAMIWLTGQEQGIGASRSQGHGRYVLTEWKLT